ncbi:teichoic acid transporter, partial [bacterium]
LKERALRAGVWTTLLSGGGVILRFGSSMLMTRMLVPDVFGVVALSSVIFTIISLLADVGLRQCVIYSERGEEQSYLDTIWSVSALRGVFITIVSALAAVGIWGLAQGGAFAPGSVYVHPDLPAVLAVTAASSLWMGVKSPKLYLLERKLDLKTIGYIDLLSMAIGTAVTLLLTWHWRSVWPIVISSHVSMIAMTLMSHYMIPGPIGRMGWDKGAIAEIIRYGRWILLSSIASVFAMSADRLLLGVWLTAAALGLYGLALNIISSVESLLSRPFVSVGMPAFSEVARRDASGMKPVYLRFRRPLDIASVLAAGFFFAFGQLLIDVIYDERYALAGRTLQILSFTLLFPRFQIAGAVHQALGHPQTNSWMNIAKLVSIFALVPIGHFLYGYEGAMWAISLHMVPAILVLFVANRRFGLNDFAYEAKTLLLWPVGWGAGLLAVWIGRPVLAWLGIS